MVHKNQSDSHCNWLDHGNQTVTVTGRIMETRQSGWIMETSQTVAVTGQIMETSQTVTVSVTL